MKWIGIYRIKLQLAILRSYGAADFRSNLEFRNSQIEARQKWEQTFRLTFDFDFDLRER